MYAIHNVPTTITVASSYVCYVTCIPMHYYSIRGTLHVIRPSHLLPTFFFFFFFLNPRSDIFFSPQWYGWREDMCDPFSFRLPPPPPLPTYVGICVLVPHFDLSFFCSSPSSAVYLHFPFVLCNCSAVDDSECRILLYQYSTVRVTSRARMPMQWL